MPVEKSKNSLATTSKSDGGDTPAGPAQPEAGLLGLPGLQWRNLGVIAGIVALLWVTAFASRSPIVIGVVAVLTAAAIGLLIWAYRWAKKQQDMMKLLQSASVSKEARQEALAKLSSQEGADKDAMNTLARAQLTAQDDPEAALALLEKVDLKKVPDAVADDVRAFRAQLYLVNGRTREARELADEIKLTSAGNPDARGMLAATVAEAWARSGKHKEAGDLLTTIKPDDPDFAKVRVPLLFARIFSAFASGNRDQVRKDLGALMKEDVNLLGRFVAPQARVHPELQKIARDMLARDPEVRKMVQKQQNRAQRRMR